MSRAEDILKYIKKNNSSTARKFDEHFGDRVEEFCQSIAPIFEGIDNAMIGNVGEPPIADHIFQGLGWIKLVNRRNGNIEKWPLERRRYSCTICA